MGLRLSNTLGAIVSLSLFLGCSQGETKQKLEALENQVTALDKKLEEIRTDSLLLRGRVLLLELHGGPSQLDPTSKNYGRVNTTSGFFLVSVQDVRPFLDGQKLILHVGNPLSATYTGFSLNVRWGRKRDTNDDFAQWSSSLRAKTFSFTDSLRPGTWNRVELVLAPAPPGELGFVEVSMETDRLSLAVGR